MLPQELRSLLRGQSGVVSRRQVLSVGAAASDIQRWRRRRELVVVHPGVYVDHTGDLSWLQRAWAAVLFGQPAALWGASALRIEDGSGDDHSPIQVAIARHRKVVAPPGVRVVRRDQLDDRVHWARSPPRQRYDDAIVDAALAATKGTTAVALVAGAVQQRRTTAARLRANLMGRAKVGEGRRWLAAVLDDVAAGTTSVLEHAYLHKVERAHGLPCSRRQAESSTVDGRRYRDVAYDGLVVELDGRAFHDNPRQRDDDYERDLDAAVAGDDTIRLTYGQVVDRSCATAGKVAHLLVRCGWDGRPVPCGSACTAVELFDDLR